MFKDGNLLIYQCNSVTHFSYPTAHPKRMSLSSAAAIRDTFSYI